MGPEDRSDDACPECGQPVVCFVCDTCAEHCVTEGGPDACWDAHESWRLGEGDATFGPDFRPPAGSVPAAPKPRWPQRS
jgi:hypothetical protein